VRCWIAPRDISPGEGWSAAILRGIETCRVMVLVFSDHANNSPDVRREVAHACGHELIVIPMRIRDTVPRGDLHYYLSELHWLDALTPPLEKHLEALTARVTHLLSSDHISPPETPPERKKPAPERRVFLRPIRLIALTVVILIGIGATICLWMSSTHKNRQSPVSPVAEAGIPIPQVVSLPDGLRLVLGQQQTLMNDTELGLHSLAGKGVAVVENKPGLLQFLIEVGNDTYLVEGTDFKHLVSAHKVLEPGAAGEFDSCGTGVGEIVRFTTNCTLFTKGEIVRVYPYF